MRFFVLVGADVRGPLTADAVRSLPELSLETPVCPEDRDHKKEDSWKAAASCPELFAQPGAGVQEPDGGASRYWLSAAAHERVAQAFAAGKAQGEGGQGRGWLWLWALALPILAIAVLDLGRPDSRPAPQRVTQPPTFSERAALLLPLTRLPRDEAQRLRSAVESTLVGGQRQIVLPADGSILKAEARFSYDPKRRELRPINEAARGLLDIRRGYRRP